VDDWHAQRLHRPDRGDGVLQEELMIHRPDRGELLGLVVDEHEHRRSNPLMAPCESTTDHGSSGPPIGAVATGWP
jgi:hypothetical protein